MIQRGFRSIAATWLAGLVALLPLAVTVAVLAWAANLVNQFVGPASFVGRLFAKLGYPFSSNPGLQYLFGTLTLLALIYLLRTLFICAFLLMPVSATTTLIFASAMGLLWLGVSPLVTGILSRVFGLAHQATTRVVLRDFWHRTAHVDIHDVGSHAFHHSSGFGHPLRVAAENLNRYGTLFFGVLGVFERPVDTAY